MQHIAILNPKWNILPKILSGEKTIETRWYVNKIAPWNQIHENDEIFIKDARKPVTAKCFVDHVEQYEITEPEAMLPILLKYKPLLGFTQESFTDLTWLNKKRYGILIFIKNVQLINPFAIDKTGFGSAAAWLCLKKDINDLIL